MVFTIVSCRGSTEEFLLKKTLSNRTTVSGVTGFEKCGTITLADEVDDVDSFELEKYGPDFEKHPRFPKRTNTEFVHVISRNEASMRVWERGSAETWACGTGTCASVMACILNGYTDNRVLVHLRGGDLTIEYDEKTNHIFMTGPATEVFSGEYTLPDTDL